MNQFVIEQIVDMPRHRVCSEFVRTLARDGNIETHGNSDLFYFMALCANADADLYYFSDGEKEQMIYPGGHACYTDRLMKELRVKSQRQLESVLSSFQERGLIMYEFAMKGKCVFYQILDWGYTHKHMKEDCPERGKSTGFFFIRDETIDALLGCEACSDMTVLLDLYLATSYRGEDAGMPYASYNEDPDKRTISLMTLARRWHLSVSKVQSVLDRLAGCDYIHLHHKGCADGQIGIFLVFYPAVMLRISDIQLDKKANPLQLSVEINDSLSGIWSGKSEGGGEDHAIDIGRFAQTAEKRIRDSMEQQGITCANCPDMRRRLYLLRSDGKASFRIVFLCGGERVVYRFTIFEDEY